MEINNNLFYFILIVFIIYFIIKIIDTISFKRTRKLGISERIRKKADWKFQKLYNRFKQLHHKEPDKNQLFRIIINASHITIRRRGNKGHWGRQKIRKYLLEKHNITDNYKMK